jgi:hypothetical protein
MLVRPLVRPLVGPSVRPHDEILRRGEGRGRGMMSKTGYVEIASRLVTVTLSLFCYRLKVYPLGCSKMANLNRLGIFRQN